MTRNDSGSITVFATVVFTGLFAMTGLAVDGGRILNARAHAGDLANAAALEGVQALDEAQYRETGTFTLDKAEAVAAARAYLHHAGIDGEVTATDREVAVIARDDVDLFFLRIVGLSSVAVASSGEATTVDGREEGP